MFKFGKRIATLLLTAAMTVASVTSAFAVNSPVSGKTYSDSTNSGFTTSGTTAKVTDLFSTSKSAVIASTITDTKTKKTYTVDAIETGTIKARYKKVCLVLNDTTQVKKQIAKSKSARKTKKIVIKAASGKKLTAAQFDEKAFKKFKGKIIVRKGAMTKKQFEELVKKLKSKRGGFKGKIIRK